MYVCMHACMHFIINGQTWKMDKNISVSSNHKIQFLKYQEFYVSGQIFVSSNFSLPEDMVFGKAHILSIITYSILFSIGLTFNTISLYKLLQERIIHRNRSKMTLLLIHLSIADLMVNTVTIMFLLHQFNNK